MAELSAVPLLINERPEVIFVPDAQLVILDLFVGNHGLIQGDELSMLNLLTMFQTVSVVVTRIILTQP
jgi:hypothetical protein